MRLLVLNHYFDQDIDALRREGGDEVDIRVVPFDRLRAEAMRVFPPDVAHGLETYARPDYAEHRDRYARRLAGLMEQLFAGRPFDAFVAPSDTFFFVRAAPEACHRLGVPFVVAQKETTISPQTMREHSLRVRELAPPVCDWMTVCSERHREFWLRAGADGDRIEVTGQPRFDRYARARAPRAAGEQRTVLFLSYQVDAYHPSEGRGGAAWSRLHAETERGLWQLAERGWRVWIKPHPQQPFEEHRRALERELGALLGSRVFLIDPLEDTRDLIEQADVVLGFQSTALFEALAADKPVVYTGWDAEALSISDELIPFDRWGDIVGVITEPDRLVDCVEAAHARGGRRDLARARVEEYLGPIDGGASARTLAAVRHCAEAFERRRTPEIESRRRTLARRPPSPHLGHRARSGIERVRALLGGAR